MTVAELIKVLETMPPDAVICLSVYRHTYDSVNQRGSHGEMVVSPWHDDYNRDRRDRVIIASSRYDVDFTQDFQGLPVLA